MPYDKNNPPAKLKNLSDSKKRQWVEVFNSCWSEHKDDGECHKMAWGVVKKAASEERMRVIAGRVAARELGSASFMEEARALKLKARVMEFFDEVKHFKGDVNAFLKDMSAAVRDPRSLQGFPEIRDVLELGEFMKRGVLKHTFLSESDVSEKMRRVVELDA